jgi:hypothetical protein
MPITIELDELLAARLKSRADAEQVTIQELATRLLEGCVDEPTDDEWSTLNRRRVELIERRFRQGLSSGEHQELEKLQLLADQQLETLDEKLLDGVAQMEASARRVTGNDH